MEKQNNKTAPGYVPIVFSARRLLSMLPDAERGRMLLDLMDYAEFGTLPDYDGLKAGVFDMLAEDIDRCKSAWQRQQEGRLRGGETTKEKWEAIKGQA